MQTLIALFILCGQNIFQTCNQMPMTLSVFGISPVNLAFISCAQHRILCLHRYMFVHEVQTFTLLILACILNLFSFIDTAFAKHWMRNHLWTKGIVTLLHLKFRYSSYSNSLLQKKLKHAIDLGKLTIHVCKLDRFFNSYVRFYVLFLPVGADSPLHSKETKQSK